MEAKQRDAKGRFLKGNNAGKTFDNSDGLATEMQARSVASRKEHRTLAETLRRELEQKAGTSGLTKLEYLVAKALENHSKGPLSLRDLTYLQKLLGEDVLNIKTDGPQVIVVSQQAIDAGKKWGK